MKFKSLIINGLAVAAATVAFTMPASATKSINLTGISGYPPAATWIGAFIDVYMPSVNTELAKTGNYKINGSTNDLSNTVNILNQITSGTATITNIQVQD